MIQPTDFAPADWDFNPLFRQVADEPWKALKQCQYYWSPQGFGHDEHVYALCGAVVGIARAAAEDATLRVRLYNHSVLANAKKKLKEANILRHTFQCAMNAPHRSKLYDLAWARAAALQELFKSDVAIEAIPGEIIDQGGIYAMLKAARERSRNHDDPIKLPARSLDGARLIRAAGSNAAKLSDKPAAARRESQRKLRFDPLRHLLFEAAENVLEDCLNLEEGEERLLRFRCNGKIGPHITVLEAVKVEDNLDVDIKGFPSALRF
jgi:hypothetical protein